MTRSRKLRSAARPPAAAPSSLPETAAAPLGELARKEQGNQPVDDQQYRRLVRPADQRWEVGDDVKPLVPMELDLPGEDLDPRMTCLTILTTLAVAYTLYFARAILFPIVFAIILMLLFRPVVRRLRRNRIPEAAGAALVILFALGVLALGIYQVSGPASQFVTNLPQQLQDAHPKVQKIVSPFQRISGALKTGEKLAAGKSLGTLAPDDNSAPGKRSTADKSAGSAAETPTGTGQITTPLAPVDSAAASNGTSRLQPPVRQFTGPGIEESDDNSDGLPDRIVVDTQQQPKLTDLVLNTTTSFLAGATLCLILLYFLLASSDEILNNILHVLPSIKEKRGVVELVYAAERGMSRYLLTVTMINAGLGFAIFLGMLLLGVPNAPLWGLMGFAFNFIPYVGALTGMCVVGLVAFLHFESISYGLLPPVVYFALTTIEGNFVTPTILGNRISLNPIVVFLALAFWGWIWGVGGALIAVPLLSMMKIVCDQFAPLQTLGTLIGASSTLKETAAQEANANAVTEAA